MICSCCRRDDSDCQILRLALGRGVLDLCRECWLEFCAIAAKALDGEDNESREGLN